MSSISEKILFLITGLGILQGVLLAAIIFFHPKSDRSVNKFLAFHIFFTSLVMTLPFTFKIVSWQNSFLVQPIPLLTGPFLYLYLRSFKESISWHKALPHFLIFFLFFFPVYWNISSWATKYPDAKIVPGEVLGSPVTITLQTIRMCQQVFYYFLVRKTLISYQRSIQHLFSETTGIDLHWVRLLTNGYLFLVLTGVVIFPLMVRYPEQFNLLLLINMVVATPYIYIATFKGIAQPTIWQIQPTINKETLEAELHEANKIEIHTVKNEKPKTAKPGLKEDKVEEVAKKITVLMEHEKLYEEPELTLPQLAGKLQLPTYQVSQAINEGMKKNFYDLVNGYRVEEAKRLLRDPKNMNFTILSVGFDAGFNSKTTFNTVFKKFTGLTPTEFRNRQEAQLSTA